MSLAGARIMLPIRGTLAAVHLEEGMGPGELCRRMSEKVATLTATG